MMTCRFAGGLGNNLYQLAFLLNHSSKYKSEYYIPNEVDRSNIPRESDQSKVLEFDKLFENKFVKQTSLNYNFSLIKDYNHGDLSLASNQLYYEVPFLQNTRYCGYFLSDKYFSDIDIKQVFSLNKQIKCKLFKKYEQIMKKPTVALHYRLGGDRQQESIQQYYNIISPLFYKKSIENILNITNKPLADHTFLLFSDDVCLASRMLKSLNLPLIPVQNENNVEDFIHMSICDYNVIGNSTFSWWSAYLNEKNREVFYPRSEWFSEMMKHVQTKDMFPDYWIGL